MRISTWRYCCSLLNVSAENEGSANQCPLFAPLQKLIVSYSSVPLATKMSMKFIISINSENFVKIGPADSEYVVTFVRYAKCCYIVLKVTISNVIISISLEQSSPNFYRLSQIIGIKFNLIKSELRFSYTLWNASVPNEGGVVNLASKLVVMATSLE